LFEKYIRKYKKFWWCKIRFCPDCDNIIIPRASGSKKKLYCKACDKEFDLDSKEQDDYKIVKTIIHDEKEIAPIIIKEGLKGDKISGEDRKAFEEFFSSGEESGYWPKPKKEKSSVEVFYPISTKISLMFFLL